MRARILVARNIRRLRVAQGVSQEALAVDAKLERTYVSRLERERKAENPSLAILERVASALGADIRDLFDPKGAVVAVKSLPGGRHKKALRKTPGSGAR
jgi:transcriptional regulator with XRE-family HTH domain